jgi:hypothetical protein
VAARSRMVLSAPAPWMLSALVIDGKPFSPSVSLSTVVNVYVPASKVMVSSSPFPFAVLIAAIRHVTSPEGQ